MRDHANKLAGKFRSAALRMPNKLSACLISSNGGNGISICSSHLGQTSRTASFTCLNQWPAKRSRSAGKSRACPIARSPAWLLWIVPLLGPSGYFIVRSARNFAQAPKTFMDNSTKEHKFFITDVSCVHGVRALIHSWFQLLLRFANLKERKPGRHGKLLIGSPECGTQLGQPVKTAQGKNSPGLSSCLDPGCADWFGVRSNRPYPLTPVALESERLMILSANPVPSVLAPRMELAMDFPQTLTRYMRIHLSRADASMSE